ncbi:MAG: hypothetical protein AW07_02848 [Candidatus Accumulibacter sp. SK-11]|nr:MAG: hypothetical protein AW07_02848 [Candidatus Accumulibacter sp. SK-11]HAY29673.1 hypothetical protein [Accumulibacter sp.]HRL77294.1 DUF3859 domain-containing protein [Candidatus Accumulibacter phosphatis]
MNRRRTSFAVSISLFISFALQSSAYCGNASAPQDNERLRLRNDTAVHYFSPEAHLKLARYYYDRGDKVQAFYISERAREIFPNEEFTPAFQRYAALTLKDSPSLSEVLESPLLAKRIRSESSVDQLEAEKGINSFLAAYPDSLGPKTAAAHFFSSTKNAARALPLYIDLYFHDPHYHVGGWAEQHVKRISRAYKASWWASRKESGKPLAQLVIEEKNPRALDVLLDDARERWDPSLAPIMISLFGNDDAYLQASSLHILLDHCADASKAVDIPLMLKSQDLVMRAMANFLAVKCLGPAHFDLVRDNLQSGIGLVQLDAVQALITVGGEEGRRYLTANQPEKRPGQVDKVLRELLAQEEAKAAADSTSAQEYSYDAKVVQAGQFKLRFSLLPSSEQVKNTGFLRPGNKYGIESFKPFGEVTAELGVSFGFRYRVTGLPAGKTKVFEMRAIHPPMKQPDGRTTTVSTAPALFLAEGDDCMYECNISEIVYTLSEPYQVLPGKWLLQLLDRGQVVLGREFNLH